MPATRLLLPGSRTNSRFVDGHHIKHWADAQAASERQALVKYCNVSRRLPLSPHIASTTSQSQNQDAYSLAGEHAIV